MAFGDVGNDLRPYYDFFAGGGMAQAGLGPGWHCVFANDIDARKAECYANNWGSEHLRVADVRDLAPASLPERAELAWASFPCQDLSLAGSGRGLSGNRSGTFWPFWRLIEGLGVEGRAPHLIVLENVCGALTSHGGRDFAAIIGALAHTGYRAGAVVMDAVHFVPQSRKRLFVVGVLASAPVPAHLRSDGPPPNSRWHPGPVMRAYRRLPADLRESWVWWAMPDPPDRGTVIEDIVEEKPKRVGWHPSEETSRLLEMMTAVHRGKVVEAQFSGRRTVGTIYKRTRPNRHGGRTQRAEVRFDGVAGCLRTPVGGSSRQTIIVVEGDRVRTRLLSPREAARLMGLSDDFWLPDHYNSAYHIAGDGLAVPVVRYLAAHILEPLAEAANTVVAAVA